MRQKNEEDGEMTGRLKNRGGGGMDESGGCNDLGYAF